MTNLVPETSFQSLVPSRELAEDLVNLAGRIRIEPVVIQSDRSQSITQMLEQFRIPFDEKLLKSCVAAADTADRDNISTGVSVSPQKSVVFSPLACDLYRALLGAVLPCSSDMARLLFGSACDAISMRRKADMLQVQLDASALQIAQNFEEQCWLRDLARNLSISRDTANANIVARGILGPLLDLLRAEDLFLLVQEGDLNRSGLINCNFGSSNIDLDGVSQLMKDLREKRPGGAIVINNAKFLDGRINSLVAVPVLNSHVTVGQIVAVNRISQLGCFGLPLIDPEFGSVEVGLIEEASVLLSTQTHNISLVLDSQHLVLGTLQAMSRAIDARDPYTQGHSERVARLSFELGQILGLEESSCQEIYVAGILHDVGKIGVPDSVLLKAGALTDEEFAKIKQHPEIGYRIIEQLGKLHFTLPGILYHHERWDGKGYPHGLQGDDIPLMARILAVADSFDAMTSSRPYRQAMPIERALSIIMSGANSQWDAMIVRCFGEWHSKRITELPQNPATPPASIIPQEPPYADLTQSLLALQL